MEIESIGSTSLIGIQQGLAGVDRNAVEIAKSGTGSIEAGESTVFISNTAKNLLEMENNSLQVMASSRTMEAFKQTVGSIIDMKV
ncbi:MAG: hypothetical protein HON94_15250 [Methylococcales bacterium]|jgi:hypothetical protein|nr:hypothetical protein [Methylococcales bacterium]MBT7408510.1 hypothetical protein [Methylococcales bacterium]